MSTRTHSAISILATACLMAVAVSGSGATAPYTESFESYGDGYDIADVPAGNWAPAGVAEVSINATVLNALVAYTNGTGLAYPLPDVTHDKLLKIYGALTNSVAGAAGGVVVTDFMLMAAPRSDEPVGNTNHQAAFYVNASDNLVIWYRDLSPSTNTWLTLTGTSLSAGEWTRIKLTKDYVNNMYQLALDDGAPLSHAEGYAYGGAPGPGSWFYMVQTNGFLSRLKTEGTEISYVDDLVVDTRSLTFDTTTFGEDYANNGVISNSISITLEHDTFADPLQAGTHYTAPAVPAGLTFVLARNSDTTATISLTGSADEHFVDTNMTLTFLDAAFSDYGQASDVANDTTDIAIDFEAQPALSYDTTTFSEATANNGSIGNTIEITLTVDTFTNATFVSPTHYEITAGSVPATLGLAVSRVDTNTVTLTLNSSATDHDGDPDGAFTFEFKAAAFIRSDDATEVEGYSTAVTVDLHEQPVVTYTPAEFAEADANDGTMNAMTITVTGDTFNPDVVSGHHSHTALPAGFTDLDLAYVNSTSLTATLTGTATAHTNDNDTTVTLTFLNTAFQVVANTALIVDTTKILGINFNDQPALNYSREVFLEAAANNGSIANTPAITITVAPNGSGETFAGNSGDDFVALNRLLTSNVPVGLSVVAERTADTELTVTFTGQADPHVTDVLDMTFELADSAFIKADAVQVTGYMNSTLEIDFNDSVLYPNTVIYTESFEGYTPGVTLGNANGWDPDGIGEVVTEAVTGYAGGTPLSGDHTKLLEITGDVDNHILSDSDELVYVDTMIYVTARGGEPVGIPTHQYAFYVNADERAVVWSGTAGGSWTTNTTVTVTTGAWHRVTAIHDYTADTFSLYLDGDSEASFALDLPMKQQSGFLSKLSIQGGSAEAPIKLDDLQVTTDIPLFFVPNPGTVFIFQ